MMLLSCRAMDSDGAGSTTLTVKPHRPRLPLSSVAVQKTVVAPTGNNVPEGGTQTTVGVVSQTSVKTGVGKLTTAPQVTGLTFAVTSPWQLQLRTSRET